ncbi:MAG: aldo/keto reductase [Acidobacteriota bacterium]
MRTTTLPSGLCLPVLGQGTWRMGEEASRRSEEVRALKQGLDLGMTLVDTAEMYHDAELVVREAIEGRRDEVYLVSKVLPENASREGTIQACERSLKRLGVEQVDLYLLHWPGQHPLEDTLAAFMDLRLKGKIAAYGLSNFDHDEMQAARELPGGLGIAANQCLYNVERRAPDARLIPACREAGVLFMSYSPFEQGRLRPGSALAAVAARQQVTPAQVALAWVLRHEGVVTIPKAVRPEHVEQNATALDIVFDEEDLTQLARAYPPPPADAKIEFL